MTKKIRDIISLVIGIVLTAAAFYVSIANLVPVQFRILLPIIGVTGLTCTIIGFVQNRSSQKKASIETIDQPVEKVA